MTCEDARLLIGAAPESLPPELEEHLRGCDGCQGFRREMLLLDADIRRALERGPPDVAGARPGRRHRPRGERGARDRGGTRRLGAAPERHSGA